MPNRRISTPRDVFDEPWKHIVPALFESFILFFLPEAWEAIDWSRTPVFLDKELRQVVKRAWRRKTTADFLVKVWLKDGEELWVLLHIELQAQKHSKFPLRIFQYNYRIFDLYGHPVISLAILADANPDWRPDNYGYEAWGSSVQIRFPVVKLLDWSDKQAELEANDNPFALVVLAHLKTLETRGDAEIRLHWTVHLTRLLAAKRRSQQEAEDLLQFLDWIMGLPEELEERFEITLSCSETIFELNQLLRF